MAGVVAAETAGAAVGPSATSIGSAADDRTPTTPGAVASAVLMLLARSLSSRVRSWGVRIDPPAGFHIWDGVPL